jgi:hypothetical protein
MLLGLCNPFLGVHLTFADGHRDGYSTTGAFVGWA